MDVWLANGASIDIRVERDDMAWLKQLGLHCITQHHSVEKLVRKFEESLSAVKQDPSWFEDYVRRNI